MKQFVATIAAWGPLGVLLLSVVDSAGMPLPGGVDALVVLVAIGNPGAAFFAAALAVLGSCIGCMFMFWVARKGGRMYLDYGSHPEHAAPECFTPQQVAAYDQAGERLLDLARRRAQADVPEVTVRVVKNNLDPCEPDNVSYGTHESYTCWAPTCLVGPRLVPHLSFAGLRHLVVHRVLMGTQLVELRLGDGES